MSGFVSKNPGEVSQQKVHEMAGCHFKVFFMANLIYVCVCARARACACVYVCI